MDETRALQLAITAGTAAGLDCAGAALMRSGNSFLVELPAASALARVERPDQTALASRQAAAAAFYSRRGAPTARILGPPWIQDEGAVTLWERLDDLGREVTPGELGRVLRALHDAAGGPLPRSLPRLTPLPPVRRALDGARAWFDPARLRAVADHAESLLAGWEALRDADPLGTVLAHGDCHQQNVVITKSGPVFVDLELAGVGPASWDLAVLDVGVRRYGRPPQEYRDFLDGYGADPSGWEGHDLLCALYELAVVAWILVVGAQSPAAADEARLRIGTLLDENEETWTLF